MRRLSIIFLIAGLIVILNGCSPSLPVLNDIFEFNNYNQSEQNIPDDPTLLYELFLADKSNQEILSKLINVYKERGDDRSCIAVYEEYLKSVPRDIDARIDLAYCQMNLGDYEEARITCEKALSMGQQNSLLYNALGNVYGDLTQYEKALENYTMANQLDVNFEPARTNILWALFNSNQYDKCIEFAQIQVQSGHDSYELYYYLGSCYEALDMLSSAIEAFTKALDFSYNDHSDAYYHLGLIAFQQERYDEASAYVQKALEQSPRHQDALWLMDELEAIKIRWPERMTKFIKDNYLYKDYVTEFEDNLSSLKKIPALPQDKAVEAAKLTLHPDDPFSFIITGSDYDYYHTEQDKSTVFYSTQSLAGKNYELFRIEAFNHMTGKYFIRFAEAIENKEDKVLVFDLRDNGGGDMKACSEILDYLLGDCVTVSFINSDGYISSYYSTADQVLFKKIILLTNSSTASASELLTLGLKVYHPDTYIIGETTFGKGVSQIFFDDPKNKLALCLVNSYWNVRENNIHGYGIYPDKEAKNQKEYDLALQNALDMIQ